MRFFGSRLQNVAYEKQPSDFNRKNVKFIGFRIETFTYLRNMLHHHGKLPEPTSNQKSFWGPICQKYMHFLTATCDDVWRQRAVVVSAKFRAKNGGRALGAQDYDPMIPCVRAKYTPRAAEKSQNIREFLSFYLTVGLACPDSSTVVLPFRSCMETHVHFVHLQEQRARCSWAEGAFERYNTQVLEEVQEGDRAHVEYARRIAGEVMQAAENKQNMEQMAVTHKDLLEKAHAGIVRTAKGRLKGPPADPVDTDRPPSAPFGPLRPPPPAAASSAEPKPNKRKKKKERRYLAKPSKEKATANRRRQRRHGRTV
jgi:hypothetical protein